MKIVKKFFSEFDMFAAPASLRIKQEPQMKSCTIGFISFCFGCLFTYVFVINCVKLFKYDKINASIQQTILKKQDVNGTLQMFAASFNFMDFTEFETMFSLNAQIFKQGQLTSVTSMKPCQPQQWKLLGDTYQTDFVNFELDRMYCPKYNGTFAFSGTLRSKVQSYLVLSLNLCDLTLPNCNQTKALQWFDSNTGSFSPSFFFLQIMDTALYPSNINSQSYVVNSDVKFALSKQFGVFTLVQFSSFEVVTDTSFMPWETQVSQQGIKLSTFQQYQFQRSSLNDTNNIINPVISYIMFTMNSKKATINRKVGKIDELLSYVGGLFSLIISFLAFFLNNYNQYRYDLKVAEGTFNYSQDGRKIKEKDFNFITYIAYSIFDWISILFAVKLNWKQCKQIDEIREQVNSHMQVNRLFKRLQNNERAIDFMLDRKDRICINLMQPPSLQQAKKIRLFNDYYDEIIKGDPAMTIQDIKVVNNTIEIAFGQAMKKQPLLKKQSQNMLLSSQVLDKRERMQRINPDQKQLQNIDNNSIIPNQLDRSKIIQLALKRFPVIRQQAQSIQLEPEFAQTEQQIAKAFENLSPASKAMIQQHIPILIIHRLNKRLKDKQLKQGTSIELGI